MTGLRCVLSLTTIALVLATSAAVAQNSATAAQDEYQNVPAGLLLTPEQRLTGTAKIDDEEPLPTIDPQIPTHSLSFLNQKQDSEDNVRVMGMPQIEAAYAQKKYAEILAPLERLIAQNDMHAALLLATMLDAGQGVTADPARATALYARAAESGLPQAQHRLALQYYMGKGVARDNLRAMMWLNIASVVYPDGPLKQRALADKNNLDLAMSRRDRETALFMAREWLTKKGISHLLDNGQGATTP